MNADHTWSRLDNIATCQNLFLAGSTTNPIHEVGGVGVQAGATDGKFRYSGIIFFIVQTSQAETSGVFGG